MNRKTGRLSARDMQTIERALEILSDWSEVMEEKGCTLDDYLYDVASSAVTSLAEFVGEYDN